MKKSTLYDAVTGTVDTTDAVSGLSLAAESEMTVLHVDLSYEILGKLALMAHEADMKLNDFMVEIMTEHAKRVLK